MFTFKHANKSIDLIEKFLDKIDQGILIFQEGVKKITCMKTRRISPITSKRFLP